MFRKILPLFVLLLTACGAFAAEEKTPDIRNYNRNSNAVYMTGNNGHNCSDSHKRRNYTRITNLGRRVDTTPQWDFSAGGIMIGFVSAPGHPATMPIEQGKSVEIGISHLIGERYQVGYFSVTLGFGFDWRNYKITTPDYRFSDFGTHIGTEQYPEGVDPVNSRLKIFTLQFPVLLRQEMPFRFLGHRQSLTAGVSLNYNSHGSMLTRWRDAEGHMIRTSTKHIGQRRFSYDIIGAIGLSEDFGIYVRYSPLSVLRGREQPSFHSFSTGLIFFM